MNRSIVEGVIAVLGGRVGKLLITLIATPLMVRVLGPGGYGIYATVFAAFGLATTVVDAGFFDGVRKFIVEDRRNSWSNEVFAFYFRTGIVVALLAATAVLAGVRFGVIHRLLGPRFNLYFLLLGAMIVARQTFLIGRGVLMGFGLERATESLIALHTIIFLFGGLLLAVSGLGVLSFLISHLFAEGIIIIAAYSKAISYISITSILKGVRSTFPRKELLLFNIQAVTLSFLLASLSHIDILLMQTFRTSSETGFYKAALAVSGFVLFVPGAIEIVFVHSTSELWADSEIQQITTLTSRTIKYNILLSGLITIGIGALASEFVRLYFGANFVEAVPALLILLPGTFALALSRPIIATGQGSGKLTKLIVAVAIAAIVNVVGNILLIPRLGLVGAAIATSTGYGLAFGFVVVAAWQIGFNPIEELETIRLIATVAIGGMIVYILAEMMPTDLIALVLVPIFGFVIYFGIAIALHVIDIQDLSNVIDEIEIGT